VILNGPVTGRAAALLLFALAALAALGRGGVDLRAQALACAGAALILFLAALPDRRGRTPRLPLIALAPGLIFAMAVAQCVPIPVFLLKLIAPVNASLRFALPAPAHTFAPITLDLTATALQLAPAFTILAALVAAALLARRQRAQLLLLAAPVAAALIQVGICFVRLLGAGALQGTFGNRNHLAGLLILGSLAAMGAALSPPREEEPGELPQLALARTLWISIAAVTSCTALLTLSRGAAIALLAGALALIWMERRAFKQEPHGPATPRSHVHRFRMLWVFLPLLLGVIAAVLVSATSLTARFEDFARQPVRTDVKLRSYLGAAQVALEHPLAGVGRGAWQFVAERHRSVPGDMAFLYVENEPLQLAAEEGLPLTLLIIGIALVGWWRASKAASSGIARGVMAGALAVGLQNLVDFNLEFIGVALPLAVGLGAAVADERGRPPPWSVVGPLGYAEPGAQAGHPPLETRGWRRIPRPAIYAAALLGLVLAPLPLLLARFTAEREAARLVFEARDPDTGAETLLADAEQTVQRHPSDWLVSLAPAIGLHQRTPRRTAEALAWVGRAQLLGPLSWRPHVVAAAIFLRAGRPAQTRVETRLALENLGAVTSPDALDLAMRASETLDDLIEATPDDPFQRGSLAVHLRGAQKAPIAQQLIDFELARDPEHRSPAATSALELELALNLSEQKSWAEAERVATRLPKQSCERGLILAAARRAQNEPPAQIEAPLLEEKLTCPQQQQIYDLLFHGRLARQDLAGAAEVLDDPLLGDLNLPFATAVHFWRAELAEAKHDGGAALHERWLAALVVSPDDAGPALDYANHLVAKGDIPGALVALRTLSLRARGDARGSIDAKIAELQKQRELNRAAANPSRLH
jgi:hypothetical protein